MKNKCLLAIVFLLIFFSLQSEEKKNELKNKIIYLNDIITDAYDYYKLFSEIDDFLPNIYFEDRYQKVKTISKLLSFYEGYRKCFYKLELFYDLNGYNAALYTDTNTRFYLTDYMKEIYQKALPNSYKYSDNDKLSNGFSFFPKYNYAFFYHLYGNTKDKRKENLIDVSVFGNKVKFNKNGNAAFYLQKACNEVEELSKTDAKIKEWISSMKHIYTYAERNVSNETRPSLHTFGIAIDFLPNKYTKYMYWLWSSDSIEEWWDILDSEKISYPNAVIKIFEKNGFCWGGKWMRFDIMHFEFRPEIVNSRIK